MLASSIVGSWTAIRPDDRLTVLSRGDVDLRDAEATRSLIDRLAPEAIIHTGAVVGGIGDKTARPLPYLLDNLRIDASVLDASLGAKVQTYVYIATAAAYPAAAPNPITEESLFEGRLEPANEGYGLAKLAGITAVRYASRQTGMNYRALLPSNLYGPHDNFLPGRSHLVAATLYKARAALQRGDPSIEVWGDGTARREFTFAPDLAHWIVSSLDRISDWPELMNIGAGIDHSVREYYELACAVVGYDGALALDPSKPSGVSQRLLDSSLARAHGWAPATSMYDGFVQCHQSFLDRSQRAEAG